MKRLIIILTLFATLLNCSFAADIKTVTKDYKIVTKDGFSMTAKLEYPKVKDKKDFSTVVLLHSLGYSSEWWGTLPDSLLNKGYAVVLVDLRGHGTSVYNSKLTRVSWKSMKNKAFLKYPDDVITVMDYIKNNNKRTFFNNWAFVGTDIGAATSVLVANKINYKPSTIVMLSPVIQTKGLYIPVKFAELNNIDVLSVTGTDDINGAKTNDYLKKFAQSTYAEYISESKSTGMLLLKNDESLSSVISAWIQQYLK
jgi:alpha-beta hydrolase superfamily lysophospholipase